MELTGKVIQLTEQTGTGRNGEWRKQEVIIETQEEYPKKICVTVWGDKVSQFALQENEIVTFSINIESREYNSRWYTDVRAWKIERDASTEGKTSSRTDDALPPPKEEPPSFDEEDALPF